MMESIPKDAMSENDTGIKSLADELKAAVKSASSSGAIPEQDVGAPKKRIRSTKEPVVTFDPAYLGPAIGALGNVICKRVGVAELDDDEVSRLAEAYSPLLSKYFGTAIEKYGPEIAAIGVTLDVALPRFFAHKIALEESSELENSRTPGERPE